MDLEAAGAGAAGIPNLKVGYNRVHGYYIEISRSQADGVPAEYHRRQTLKNAERYITPELKAFEDKALCSQEPGAGREKALYDELLERLNEQLAPAAGSAAAVANGRTGQSGRARRHLRLCRPQYWRSSRCSKSSAGRHLVVEQVMADTLYRQQYLAQRKPAHAADNRPQHGR